MEEGAVAGRGAGAEAAVVGDVAARVVPAVRVAVAGWRGVDVDAHLGALHRRAAVAGRAVGGALADARAEGGLRQRADAQASAAATVGAVLGEHAGLADVGLRAGEVADAEVAHHAGAARAGALLVAAGEGVGRADVAVAVAVGGADVAVGARADDHRIGVAGDGEVDVALAQEVGRRGRGEVGARGGEQVRRRGRGEVEAAEAAVAVAVAGAATGARVAVIGGGAVDVLAAVVDAGRPRAVGAGAAVGVDDTALVRGRGAAGDERDAAQEGEGGAGARAHWPSICGPMVNIEHATRGPLRSRRHARRHRAAERRGGGARARARRTRRSPTRSASSSSATAGTRSTTTSSATAASSSATRS